MNDAPSKKERNFIRLALKKIGEGTVAFNEWRVSQGRKYFDLSRQDFNQVTLDGVNFQGVKFTRSNFRGAALQGANFVSANLNKVDFTGAKLVDADFHAARMSQTVMDDADLNGANLSLVLRDGWSIKGVKCERCWITKSRTEAPDSPDLFKPGEFEAVYGGARVRVVFANGFQPIDLLALPFYVKSFADKFAGKRLVFVGLNTLETPSLEFRVEDIQTARDVGRDMQLHFDHEVADVRQMLRRQLDQKDQQIAALTDLANTALKQIKGANMIINNNNTGPTMIQETGIQAGSMVGNEIKQLNMGDATHMGELAKQLQSLIERLPTQSDATAKDKQLLLEATDAAKANDEHKVRSALKKAGGWLLKFANDVGVSVVADAIKQSAGIK